MSYLQLPRLVFAGRFQADVSTVNNDPRHFDNSTFDPSFQDFQADGQFKGWWNPVGTGIFRLSDCKVTGLEGPDGPVLDHASSCAVGNSPDQPSAKLVDIDPDWQLASSIFGQVITLADPQGNIVMQGNYQPNPFRDLWFTRAANQPGDSAASAVFQSVLTDVQWNLNVIDSPFLRQLQQISEEQGNILSIRLTTFAFNGNNKSPQFSYGTVLGAIGPAYATEPRSFILGRRFMPQGNGVMTNATPPGVTASANNITCFPAILDDGGKVPTLHLDLSNALPLDQNFQVINLGDLQLAVVTNPSAREGSLVTAADYVSIGAIDFDQAAFMRSGIQSFRVNPTAFQSVPSAPLALIQADPSSGQGEGTIMIMESPNGLEIRVEDFVVRLDPNDPARNSFATTVYAAQWGQPLQAVPDRIRLMNFGPVSDSGDCPPSIPAETTPQATIPTNNLPSAVVGFQYHPAESTGFQIGTITLVGPSEFGAPRSYIDGQIYNISYNFTGNDAVVQQQFDCFAILVFSTYTASADPSWEEVQPILQQYANLYPVMSKGLFDFSQRTVADAQADTLYAVFSNNNFNDPDYMPVTRDMSSSKRQALTAYFDKARQALRTPHDFQQRFAARCPFGFGKKG